MAFKITKTSSAFVETDLVLTVEFDQAPPPFSQPPQAGQLSSFGRLTFLEDLEIDLESEQNNPGQLNIKRPSVFEGTLVAAAISYSSKGFTIRIPFARLLSDFLMPEDGQLDYRFEIGVRRGFDPISTQSATGVELYPTNAAQITGTNGIDFLTGTLFNNEIRGLNGSDRISSFSGNDKIYGGSDNDSIDAGTGKDTIYGDDGNDIIVYRDGGDKIYGGPGSDQILDIIRSNPFSPIREIDNNELYGGDGNDIISGTGFLSGGGGIDVLTGSGIVNGDEGNDRLEGSQGVKDGAVYNGGDGNDIFATSDGKDILNGGNGNDVLDGYSPFFSRGGGRRNDIDQLTGGAGQDRFILGQKVTSPLQDRAVYYLDNLNGSDSDSTFATITDFNPQEDKIVLQGLASQYRLVTGASGTQIFYARPDLNLRDDLIATISNVRSGLNLSASYFTYI